MKKIFILFLTVFFVVACSKDTKENEQYNNYLNELEGSYYGTPNYDYDINVSYEKFNSLENIYQITIDNFKEEHKDLKVILYHNAQTNDIFPSYGFYEKEGFSKKGLNLIGYINKDSIDPVTFKVMVVTSSFKNIHILTVNRK